MKILKILLFYLFCSNVTASENCNSDLKNELDNLSYLEHEAKVEEIRKTKSQEFLKNAESIIIGRIEEIVLEKNLQTENIENNEISKFARVKVSLFKSIKGDFPNTLYFIDNDYRFYLDYLYEWRKYNIVLFPKFIKEANGYIHNGDKCYEILPEDLKPAGLEK